MSHVPTHTHRNGPLRKDPDPATIGLLLPTPELREQIYALVFAPLKAATLRIYKLSRRPPWLIRYHSGITSPPLLRTSKIFYFEARATMLKLLGPPTIVVEQVDDYYEVPCGNFYGHSVNYWTFGVPAGCKPEMRPLEAVTLLLMGVRELRIEVTCPCDGFAERKYAEDVRLHALLRWMGAVFAARETALRRLIVVVNFDAWWETLEPEWELYCLLLALRSEHLIIQFQRPGKDILQPVCVDVDDQSLEAMGGSWEDVELAWAAVLESCAHWPERQPQPNGYLRLLWAREWCKLWDVFGKWLRGEL